MLKQECQTCKDCVRFCQFNEFCKATKNKMCECRLEENKPNETLAEGLSVFVLILSVAAITLMIKTLLS